MVLESARAALGTNANKAARAAKIRPRVKILRLRERIGIRACIGPRKGRADGAVVFRLGSARE